MAIFTGSGTAIITPMNPDQTVNYDKLRELIDFQISSGADAIIICGTTGESSTLSEEEHTEAIRAAVSFVDHRVPVIAGTGSNSTETAIYLTSEAQKAGVDGALIVTPYYNKGNPEGLIHPIIPDRQELTCPSFFTMCRAEPVSTLNPPPRRSWPAPVTISSA